MSDYLFFVGVIIIFSVSISNVHAHNQSIQRGRYKFLGDCELDGNFYSNGKFQWDYCNDCICSDSRFVCEDNCLLTPELSEKIKSYNSWNYASYAEYKELSGAKAMFTNSNDPSSWFVTLKVKKNTLIYNNNPPEKFYDARKVGKDSYPISYPLGTSWTISIVGVLSNMIANELAAFEDGFRNHRVIFNPNPDAFVKFSNTEYAWNYINNSKLTNVNCYPKTPVNECKKILNYVKNVEYNFGDIYHLTSEEEIMKEIFARGSVQATIEVFQDLLLYRSGIYRRKRTPSEEMLGYQSVRIVGWGETDNYKYWIVANSWGKHWGYDHGYILFERGTNMCGIESFVIRVELLSILFHNNSKLITLSSQKPSPLTQTTPKYDGDGKDPEPIVEPKNVVTPIKDKNNNGDYEDNAKPKGNTTLVVPVKSKNNSYDTEPFGPRRSLIITKNKNYPTKKSLPRQFKFWNKWHFTYLNRRDQGECNGSWAISTIEVISDRLSIARKKNELKNSTDNEDIVNNRRSEPVCLSSKHVILCNTANGNRGCQGGFPDEAWNWIHETGRVYNEESFPWDATVCNAPKFDKLESSLSEKVFKIGRVFRITGVENIMREIEGFGPVQASMMVYDDLYKHNSGAVYKHSKDAKQLGWHSVRLLGWGVDESHDTTVEYWIAVSSWGRNQNNRGFFFIEKGSNECEIESYVLAADVDIRDNLY